MKRGWIIFLSILAVVLIAIGIYAYHVYSIVKELQTVQTTYAPEIQQDFQQVASGDCSRQENLNSNIDKTKSVISRTCSDILLKKVMVEILKKNNILIDPCTMFSTANNPLIALQKISTKICTTGRESVTQEDLQSLTQYSGLMK